MWNFDNTTYNTKTTYNTNTTNNTNTTYNTNTKNPTDLQSWKTNENVGCSSRFWQHKPKLQWRVHLHTQGGWKVSPQECFFAGNGGLFMPCCSPPPLDHCEGDLPGQTELQDNSHLSSVRGKNSKKTLSFSKLQLLFIAFRLPALPSRFSKLQGSYGWPTPAMVGMTQALPTVVVVVLVSISAWVGQMANKQLLFYLKVKRAKQLS